VSCSPVVYHNMASYPYDREGSGRASLDATEAKVVLWSTMDYIPRIKAMNMTIIL
jgi:hypothetical protein